MKIKHSEIEFNWRKSRDAGVSISMFTIYNHDPGEFTADEIAEYLKGYWNNPRGADGVILKSASIVGVIPEDYNSILVCIVTVAAYLLDGVLTESSKYFEIVNSR